MKPGAWIAAAIEILESVNAAWESGGRAPADGLMSQYYRERRFIGSKDRGRISDWVYYVLRNGSGLEWHFEQVKQESSPRLLVLLSLLLRGDVDMPQLDSWLSGEEYSARRLTFAEKTLLEQFAGKDLEQPEMPDAVRYNYPDWMEKRLRIIFGDEFDAGMRALNAEASVDVRANTLKTNRDDLLKILTEHDFAAEKTEYANNCLRLKKRGALFTLAAFNQGWFEMQDEGSQLVAQLVQAKAGDKVVDFCAGAGGKTLGIAAAMQNRGRILAWDTNERRLGEMPKRLARAGVNNVQLRVLGSESDAYIKRHKQSADWVLTDVPCSGSGTWRRSPDLKWRTMGADLEEIKAIQKKIINSAARLVKPGGHLVYATCSLFTDENEDQINFFLKEHPNFKLVPHGIAALGEGDFLRLYPHKHQTDGFFGAVLQRDGVI